MRGAELSEMAARGKRIWEFPHLSSQSKGYRIKLLILPAVRACMGARQIGDPSYV
jgi:hypothetical protein